MTNMQRVSIRQLEKLKVFGKDHYSIDGSPVRDYTHVVDLAKGHVAALVKLNQEGFKGWHAYNLGTGKGTSVLEMIDAYEFITGRKIPYEIAPRRKDDIFSTIIANVGKAKDELKWEALWYRAEIINDTWKFLYDNPKGYNSDTNEKRISVKNMT